MGLAGRVYDHGVEAHAAHGADVGGGGDRVVDAGAADRAQEATARAGVQGDVASAVGDDYQPGLDQVGALLEGSAEELVGEGQAVGQGVLRPGWRWRALPTLGSRTLRAMKWSARNSWAASLLPTSTRQTEARPV